MTEHSLRKIRPVRATTIRLGYYPGPDCEICGYKANNVRHERDPEHAPEGLDYFRPMLHELHDFQDPR